MSRRFLHNVRGTAALEFALVVPLFLAVLFGAIAMGLAVWQRNILQDIAGEAARCIALGSSSCSSVPSGCSGSASTCYAVTLAQQRGLLSLQASQVTVNAAATINGLSFTTVSVSYPFSLVNFSTTLSASASFPNGG